MLTAFGLFLQKMKLRTVSRSTYHFSNPILPFLFLVTIGELMDKGLVSFKYWKLAFSIGGDPDDLRPNKVYSSLRVSFLSILSWSTFTFP